MGGIQTLNNTKSYVYSFVHAQQTKQHFYHTHKLADVTRPSLSGMGADVPSCVCTRCTAVRVSAANFWLHLLRFVRALPVYPTINLGRCSYVAVFVDSSLLTAAPIYIRVVGVAAMITDAGWSRGPYLAVQGNTDIPILAAGTPQHYICL